MKAQFCPTKLFENFRGWCEQAGSAVGFVGPQEWLGYSAITNLVKSQKSSRDLWLAYYSRTTNKEPSLCKLRRDCSCKTVPVGKNHPHRDHSGQALQKNASYAEELAGMSSQALAEEALEFLSTIDLLDINKHTGGPVLDTLAAIHKESEAWLKGYEDMGKPAEWSKRQM